MWNPFKFDDFDVDNLPNITVDRCPDEAIVMANEKEDNGEEIFFTSQLTTECGDSCKKSVFNELDDIDVPDDEDPEEIEEELEYDEVSPFEESSDIFSESVFGEEDDEIAQSVEDMPDDDDPEIDTTTEGIDEIEQDIIDDEEDDLIDAAMSEDDE